MSEPSACVVSPDFVEIICRFLDIYRSGDAHPFFPAHAGNIAISMTAIRYKLGRRKRRAVAATYQRKYDRSIRLQHIRYELISLFAALAGPHDKPTASENDRASLRFSYGRIARSALRHRIVSAVAANSEVRAAK